MPHQAIDDTRFSDFLGCIRRAPIGQGFTVWHIGTGWLAVAILTQGTNGVKGNAQQSSPIAA